jgi:hypothetical protein
MGAATYKGIVEWEDDFDGETSTSTFATANRNVQGLFESLMAYATRGTLINLEIKRVGSD